MKKLLALFLALCFVLPLAACDDEEEPAPAPQQQEENEPETPETPAPENPPVTAQPETPVKEEKPETPAQTQPSKGEAVVLEPEKNANRSVADYVKDHGEELARTFADNFSASMGDPCTCSIQASGNRMILKVCISSLVDLPQDLRESMQAAYDILGTSYKEMFLPIMKLERTVFILFVSMPLK